MKNDSTKSLIELRKGQRASILSIGNGNDQDPRVRRLLEMGFIEGCTIEIVHEAPFGGDPLAVDIRGNRFALGRTEASFIQIQEIN